MTEFDHNTTDETKPVSKIPSMAEVTSMATKLFKDIKKSVTEIYDDYKDKRQETPASSTKVEPKDPE